MKLKLLLITALSLCCLLPPTVSYSQTRRTFNAGSVNSRKVNDKQAEELELPLALPDEFFVENDKVVEMMSPKQNFSNFRIRVSSRIETRVIIEWDDRENVRMTGPEGLRYHLKANEPRSFVFTAYGSSTGVLRIKDEEGNLIKEIPYKIFKESTYGHNVGLSTSYDNNSNSPRVSTSYSLRRKKQYDDEGSWTVRFGASTKLDDLDDYRFSVNANYSW